MSHRVETLAVRSLSLDRTLPCTLLVPQGRAALGILYLLHGGHSHHREWAERMDLARMLSAWPLAVALPEGDASLWISGHSGEDWERYAAFEVPEAVESHLGLAGQGARRAVAGLSMGGFGAFHLGLTYPERYRAVATLSGAFGMTWWNLGRVEGSPFLHALGPMGSGTRAFVDPWRTLERAVARVGVQALPPLWLTTGTGDDPEVTEAHRALEAALRAAGLAVTAFEKPGGHTWDFWATETPHLLGFVATALGLEPTAAA